MNGLELVILSLGLAMDAFAVAVCKGLALGKLNIKHYLIVGLWFGGFQALMPLIGFLLGRTFSGYITRFSHWIAFTLLVIIGINMVREAFGEEENTTAGLAFGTMFILAIATSIDALAVGVTLAFLQVNIWLSIALIGLITFCMSAAGLHIGNLFGTRYRKRAELAGGVILILLGTKILLEGIGILP